MNPNTLLVSTQTGFPNENQIDIKDVENSMRNLNMKNRQELKDLFQNPRDHLTAYELTDENLQAFRKLRKFCFSFTVYKNDF